MFKATLLFALLLTTLVSAAEVPERIKQRNEKYGSELEIYFRDYLVTKYPERATKVWRRSYASPQAFVASVEPNRQRYLRMLSPPDLKPVGPLERKRQSIPGVTAEWLSLPLGFFKAEALLVIPENATKPVPLIIAQHGIDSFPERVFGVNDDEDLYITTTATPWCMRASPVHGTPLGRLDCRGQRSRYWRRGWPNHNGAITAPAAGTRPRLPHASRGLRERESEASPAS